MDVVGQFKDTRDPQPDNVERNAVLFFLPLLIVLPFRSDEDHSPSGPVHPSRGTDDALNSLAAIAPCDEKYIRADSCSGRWSVARAIRHDYVTPKCDRTGLRKLVVQATAGDQRRGGSGLMATESKSSLCGESMPTDRRPAVDLP